MEKIGITVPGANISFLLTRFYLQDIENIHREMGNQETKWIENKVISILWFLTRAFCPLKDCGKINKKTMFEKQRLVLKLSISTLGGGFFGCVYWILLWGFMCLFFLIHFLFFNSFSLHMKRLAHAMHHLFWNHPSSESKKEKKYSDITKWRILSD